MLLEALRRGVRAALETDADRNLLVAQGRAPYAAQSLKGEGLTIQTTTLFAPLVAYPTTTAILEIFNNGNRAAIVRDLFAAHILATAVVQTHAIYAMLTTQKAPPTLTALVQSSLSGKELKTTTARSELVTGVGTTVVANGWRPYGGLQNFNLGAATPGESWSVPVDGKLVIFPDTSLCLHVVGSLATASSFQCGCTLDMVDI